MNNKAATYSKERNHWLVETPFQQYYRQKHEKILEALIKLAVIPDVDTLDRCGLNPDLLKRCSVIHHPDGKTQEMLVDWTTKVAIWNDHDMRFQLLI